MKRGKLFLGGIICLTLSACSSQSYTVCEIQASRTKMDSIWDEKARPEMQQLLDSYKTELDEKMNVSIGFSAHRLEKGLPQSLLSNFTSDAIKEKGDEIWENVDFAVVNLGSLRYPLPQGTLTIGNLYETYAFDDYLFLLELPGSTVKELFDFIAKNGGEGVSKEIELVIQNEKISSLKIGGEMWDKNKTYRVVTFDYLAAGNDNMTALLQATRVLESAENLRDVMIEYVKNLTQNKKQINATLDNRIIINP